MTHAKGRCEAAITVFHTVAAGLCLSALDGGLWTCWVLSALDEGLWPCWVARTLLTCCRIIVAQLSLFAPQIDSCDEAFVDECEIKQKYLLI